MPVVVAGVMLPDGILLDGLLPGSGTAGSGIPGAVLPGTVLPDGDPADAVSLMIIQAVEEVCTGRLGIVVPELLIIVVWETFAAVGTVPEFWSFAVTVRAEVVLAVVATVTAVDVVAAVNEVWAGVERCWGDALIKATAMLLPLA